MKALDAVTDVVLAYRPKPKTKAAKRRIRRNKRKVQKIILREGQHWDEVGSAVVNAQSRQILILGNKRLTYVDEVGRQKTVLISSFLRWARTFAECKSWELNI